MRMTAHQRGPVRCRVARSRGWRRSPAGFDRLRRGEIVPQPRGGIGSNRPGGADVPHGIGAVLSRPCHRNHDLPAVQMEVAAGVAVLPDVAGRRTALARLGLPLERRMPVWFQKGRAVWPGEYDRRACANAYGLKERLQIRSNQSSHV